MKLHPAVYAIHLLVAMLVALLAFHFLLPAQASQLSYPSAYLASGPSEVASGIITGNVASRLTFSSSKSQVIVSNRTGSTAYVKFNEITATVSSTNFDVVLDDKEDVFIGGPNGGWLWVKNLTVYVSPTAGFRAVGWWSGE